MMTQKRRFRWQPVLLVAALLLLTGSSRPSRPARALPAASLPVHVTSTPLEASQTCTGAFVTHSLNHTTTTGSKSIGLYESNGAGVAINDLDQDGLLDIVLANLAGPNTILWNQGHLHFRAEALSNGPARAVNIVDVDGDGRPDLVFTQQFAKPAYWHNTGQAGAAHFQAAVLPGVNNPFYSMNWADVNGDDYLDLVAGSYDTELRKQQGAIFDYRGGGVGVFVYLQQGAGFTDQRLTKQADALTIVLPDLDADGRPDILVGNDFNRPDAAWLNTGGAEQWTPTQPFRSTTENTMSIDVGDIDNDGSPELFATDMKPATQDVATLARWLPMMDKMTRPSSSADPQYPENALQIRQVDGRYQNEAYARYVDATGWSWSSKFGDLDNDGFLDIYVVNGMIAEGLFSYLPRNELVEANRALRNDGHGYFALAPEWRLGSLASGRGMSMGDLDNDGDLEIVVNNLASPAQLFENQLCSGASLEVDLAWPQSHNPAAIGAQVALLTSTGTYYRDVRVASGYLSGDPTRLHFGFPKQATLQKLQVRWPDGALSWIDEVRPGIRLLIERTQ